jgi:hypothetical protein
MTIDYGALSVAQARRERKPAAQTKKNPKGRRNSRGRARTKVALAPLARRMERSAIVLGNVLYFVPL